MNTLKHNINADVQSRCKNLAHLDPISLDEEKFQVPMSSVPVASMLPPPPATSPSFNTPVLISQPMQPPTDTPAKNMVHISILSPLVACPCLSTTPQSALPLTTAEWSALIAKVQTGEVPPTAQPLLADHNVVSTTPPCPPCQSLHGRGCNLFT